MFRTITVNELFDFEKICVNLQKLKRMNKKDEQIMTLRAQNNRDIQVAKEHSKKKREHKHNKEVKSFCFVTDCEDFH